ncbi:hypothetical protein D3C75_1316740 [compost metagenome]
MVQDGVEWFGDTLTLDVTVSTTVAINTATTTTLFFSLILFFRLNEPIQSIRHE